MAATVAGREHETEGLQDGADLDFVGAWRAGLSIYELAERNCVRIDPRGKRRIAERPGAESMSCKQYALNLRLRRT